MEYLRVSESTISQLKKHKGLKEAIERDGKTVLNLGAGAIGIEGEGGDVWITEQAIKALDYGFSPNIAFKLFNDNFFLDMLDLELIFRGNKKTINRYKGRVIGLEGKIKKHIEELSHSYISVSGNKVFIIGEFEDLKNAKEAIMRILEGSEHSSVFSFLGKRVKEQKILGYR